MALTRSFMLARAHARDAAYNGRFLTGVVSTGIYCLPSCSSRRPREENVRFFLTEEAAQGAGLRACLRCRPDRFYRDEDPDLERVESLVGEIRRNPAAFPNVAGIEARSGLGVTKLNALFRRHVHATPGECLQRARVAAAARALAEGTEKIIDVAAMAGFESLSAFNENFRAVMALSPGAYRRLGASREFTLALPADFRRDHTLHFWGRDAASVCEKVNGNIVVKGIHAGGSPAILAIAMRRGMAFCTVEAPHPLAPGAMRGAHAVALRMLGLGCDPSGFEGRMGKIPALAPLIRARSGLRIPQTSTVFEGLVWAIIGQQINLPFAFNLRLRLVELAGDRSPDGVRVHPDAHAVARLDVADLTRLQFSRRKAEYLIDTARLVAAGDLPVEQFPDHLATRVERALSKVRGIGPWSTAYVMLRGCGFGDCVPLGDSGLVRALERFFELAKRPDRAETAALMARFAPHRSLATYHLWATIGGAA